MLKKCEVSDLTVLKMILGKLPYKGASQVALVEKNLHASAGDVRDTGLISGSGRSPGGGHGNPFQLFLLGKSHGQRSLAGYHP